MADIKILSYFWGLLIKDLHVIRLMIKVKINDTDITILSYFWRLLIKDLHVIRLMIKVKINATHINNNLVTGAQTCFDAGDPAPSTKTTWTMWHILLPRHFIISLFSQ